MSEIDALKEWRAKTSHIWVKDSGHAMVKLHDEVISLEQQNATMKIALERIKGVQGSYSAIMIAEDAPSKLAAMEAKEIK